MASGHKNTGKNTNLRLQSAVINTQHKLFISSGVFLITQYIITGKESARISIL